MAILRPHISKIGNRHYRKLAFEGSQSTESPDNQNDGGRYAIKFLVRLHGEYNILVKLWCFHKA